MKIGNKVQINKRIKFKIISLNFKASITNLISEKEVIKHAKRTFMAPWLRFVQLSRKFARQMAEVYWY